jgi:hypothetical protein
MIQNVSQGRENKSITMTDLLIISHAAWTPFYGGGAQHYSQSSSAHVMLHGYIFQLEYYCVKGVGNGQAKLCWIINVNCDWHDITGMAVTPDRGIVSPIKCSAGKTYACSTIYKGLNVELDEIKILVMPRLYEGNSVNRMYFPNGTVAHSKSISEKLGLYLMRVENNFTSGHSTIGEPIVIIFTPKPGLFEETVPPTV